MSLNDLVSVIFHLARGRLGNCLKDEIDSGVSLHLLHYVDFMIK